MAEKQHECVEHTPSPTGHSAQQPGGQHRQPHPSGTQSLYSPHVGGPKPLSILSLGTSAKPGVKGHHWCGKPGWHLMMWMGVHPEAAESGQWIRVVGEADPQARVSGGDGPGGAVGRVGALNEPQDSGKSATGRPPFACGPMLRIHFLEQGFGLSDPAMIDACSTCRCTAPSSASMRGRSGCRTNRRSCAFGICWKPKGLRRRYSRSSMRSCASAACC